MILDAAIAADRAEDFETAAEAYEKLVRESPSPEVLLRLTLLYWQATDPGVAAARRFDEFFVTAGRRWPELLTEALRLYPANGEVRFWNRYIRWAELGETLTDDECRRFLSEDPPVLAAAMCVFGRSGGREAVPETTELLRRSRDDGTAGARYVASVIESTTRRSASARKPRVAE